VRHGTTRRTACCWSCVGRVGAAGLDPTALRAAPPEFRRTHRQATDVAKRSRLPVKGMKRPALRPPGGLRAWDGTARRVGRTTAVLVMLVVCTWAVQSFASGECIWHWPAAHRHATPRFSLESAGRGLSPDAGASLSGGGRRRRLVRGAAEYWWWNGFGCQRKMGHRVLAVVRGRGHQDGRFQWAHRPQRSFQQRVVRTR